MRFALDTNSVIHFLRGRGQVGARLRAVAPTDVGLSAIVAHELAVGVARSADPARHRRALDAFLSHVRVWPFDLADAEAAAQVRADLAGKGTPIGPYDSLIAGAALARGLTLVTHDTREFSRVPGLRLEDWYEGD